MKSYANATIRIVDPRRIRILQSVSWNTNTVYAACFTDWIHEKFHPTWIANKERKEQSAIMHDKIANEAHKGAKLLRIRYIDIFF